MPNFLIFLGAALIPLIMGAIWYNPKVLGKAWMEASGISEERAQSGNMLLIFLFTYILSLFICVALYGMVVHQWGLFSLLGADKSPETLAFLADFMEKYGDMHRTFSHGALHGAIAGVSIAWPIAAIISMFERRGWKYTAIHAFYWIISLALMGGVICQFA